MKRVKVSEGEVFPVKFEGGIIGFGVIARRKPKSIGLLAYLFGKDQVQVDGDDGEWKSIKAKPSDAIVVLRMFDNQLINGEWPIVGRIEPWIRTEWPVPIFLLKDALRDDLASLISYSDEDPLLEVGRRWVPASTPGYERDGLTGCEGAAFILAKRLEDPTFRR